MSSYWNDKDKRKAYAKEHYAKQKAEREYLKQWKAEHPEEYPNKVEAIHEKQAAELAAVLEFRNLVGYEFFKAVSVHVCPDLTCGCNIGETPAMTSPVIRAPQVCGQCKQTYSALLYNVGWTTTNQHTCSQYGIFIMTPEDYKKSSDVEHMNMQWRSKILLAGDGEPANVYTTKQYWNHNTLKWFKPSKALYGICSGCNKPILDGMVSFSGKERIQFSGEGESDLMCSRCCTTPEKYPYGFEVREDGVGFFKNSDFNWTEHIDVQRNKAEAEMIRYRNLLEGLK